MSARSQRVGAKQLDIPLNEGDKLMMIRKGQKPFRFGSLAVQVIAPLARDLEIFRDKWNDWLRKNRDTVKKLRVKARVDEEKIGNDIDALLTPLALDAKELGDRDAVTPPNLASIMLYIEDGGRSILLTGDGHPDDILKGLEFVKVLAKGGSLHIDVMKVPHHGSEHNMTKEFAERVTADHYVFCGNGYSGNPEPAVMDVLFDSRVKSKAGPDRPFAFHFNSSREAESTKSDRARHMAAIEKQVEKLRAKDKRLNSSFLRSGSFFDLDVN